VIEEESKEVKETPKSPAKPVLRAPVEVSMLPLKKPEEIASPSSGEFDPIKD